MQSKGVIWNMKKSERVWFFVGAVMLIFSFAAGVAELFGVSVCFFGTPLHGYLALPICLFSVMVCCFLCKQIAAVSHEGTYTLQNKLLRAALIVLCIFFVCITVILALWAKTDYSGQTMSEDKAYKVFYEVETDDAEPIAHLYRRYSPFLMTYRNSAVLYGFTGELSDVQTEWLPSYCAISYQGYGDDAQTAEDLQVLSRKLYYEKKDAVQ